MVLFIRGEIVKNKKMIIILIAILVVIILGVVFILTRDKKETSSSDALKFKEEYESLNGTKRESDGASYNDVNIYEDNPIKYVTISEALNILDSEKAVIYIGANWCPWCRNAVPVLIDTAKDYDVKKIYYLNLDEDKSNFEVQDGNLVKTREGTEDYYKLLDKLSDILSDYILKEDGKEYNTNEKRIYMPFVIGIKDGKVVDSHTGTVDLSEGQSKYDSLTSEQREELYNIYSNLFANVFGSNSCNEEEKCS